MSATYILTMGATATECPVWDVQEQRLYWAGHLDGMLFSSTQDGQDVRVWRVPGLLTAFALREAGGAIVCSGTRVCLLDLNTSELTEAVDLGGTPAMNLNDGKVDRQGRFVIGLTDLELLLNVRASRASAGSPARGGYYGLDTSLSASLLTDGIGVTNGPCFSPDGSTLYCADSLKQRIYAMDYDVACGRASNRRVIAAFDGTSPEGRPIMPDGATVDEEGFIWVAAINGGEIRRYAPDGTLASRLAFPVQRPTSVAFGGRNMDVLYVTSAASEGLEVGEPARTAPLAGAVFAIRGLGVRGIPERRFLG